MLFVRSIRVPLRTARCDTNGRYRWLPRRGWLVLSALRAARCAGASRRFYARASWRTRDHADAANVALVALSRGASNFMRAASAVPMER